MFDRLDMAPADPILGLEEAFRRDQNPAKISLSAGVYKDAAGNTPVLAVVKAAEALILQSETSKTYLGIDGSPEYAAVVQELLFGEGHPVPAGKLAVTAHTPGGTGGLRIAADLIKDVKPDACVWVSQPTWPNHPNVFRAAGLKVQTYPYFDAATNGLAFEPMLATLNTLPAGDVVVLHGCCHNPTGVDLTPAQWERVAGLLDERGLVPLIDFAYQGLAGGIREDAAGVATICRPGREVLIANSFSKNFGLYNERVGALTVVSHSPEAAQAALSHIKISARVNYSNPPAHGARIVTTVLRSPELNSQWAEEVAAMRWRIRAMRDAFVAGLASLGVQRDFAFISRQRGMFSFTGLTKEQVRRLREEHSIYIVDSGRINVAGLTETNLPTVCQAIAQVL